MLPRRTLDALVETWLFDGSMRISSALKICRYARRAMRVASRAQKKPVRTVRRRESAMRPSTPDSGVSRCEPKTLPETPAPSTSACSPVPSWPQRKRKPTAMKLASRDVPPWLMKGSVTPVSGMRPMTPPAMRNACRAMEVVRPTAMKAARSERARAAVSRPRTASRTNRRMTAAAPRRPISSAMAEKMKSLSTTGIIVAIPWPMPVPMRLPSAME